MAVQESSLVIENPSPLTRNVLIEYLRRWGGSTTDALLDPGCKIFTTSGIEGLIGYRDETKCVVSYGDPVCASKDIPLLTTAFHRYCTQLGKDIIYVATSKSFTHWALENLGGASIEFGAELTINPQNDPQMRTGSNAQMLRGKVRHAERTGVIIHEYDGENPAIEKHIEEIAMAWLAARKGPQVYIAHVNLFDDRVGKRWLYATMQNRIVGVVMLHQLKEHKGWLLNRLMTSHAPSGTSELLVISALNILKEEGCEFASFGIAPSAELNEIVALGKLAALLARKVYRLAYRFLKLEGQRKFWEKYHPQEEPCYLLFSKKGLGMKELSSLMHALNIGF